MSVASQMALMVQPWADFYGNNPAAQTTVAFGHFGGMMTCSRGRLGGGCTRF